jgi:hypothetical protein
VLRGLCRAAWREGFIAIEQDVDAVAADDRRIGVGFDGGKNDGSPRVISGIL